MPADENNSKQADALRCEVCVLSADDEKKKKTLGFPHFVLFFFFLYTSHFLCFRKRVSPCGSPAAERLQRSDRDVSSDHQITFAPYNCQDKEPICESLHQKGVR